MELSNFHLSGKCCLFGSSLSERLAVRNEFWHRVASNLWHVPLFLRKYCQLLRVKVGRYVSSDLLCVGTEFGVSFHWQIHLQINNSLHAYGLDQNLLFLACALEMVIHTLLPQCQSDGRWKYGTRSVTLGYFNHLQCDNNSWNSRSNTCFSDDMHQCPLPELCRKCGRFNGTVHTNICVAFPSPDLSFSRSVSLHIDMNMILSSKKNLHFARSDTSEHVSWCQDWKHLATNATWMELLGLSNSTVRQIRVCSVCTPILMHICWMNLDSRLQHNVESENTWTFMLINFAAGSLGNLILD